jgi:hypothetical protein
MYQKERVVDKTKCSERSKKNLKGERERGIPKGISSLIEIQKKKKKKKTSITLIHPPFYIVLTYSRIMNIEKCMHADIIDTTKSFYWVPVHAVMAWLVILSLPLLSVITAPPFLSSEVGYRPTRNYKRTDLTVSNKARSL